MKRLTEDEYNPDPDSAPDSDPDESSSGPHSEADDTSRTWTTTEEEANQQSQAGRLLPEGLKSVEGEIPDEMFGDQPAPDGEQSADEEAETEGDSPDEQATDEEEGTSEGEEDEQMDDVNASEGWVDEFTKKTGLDAENEKEAIDTVRTMQRDLRGFSELEQVLGEVPQAAQLIHNLSQTEGEIDPVDFYLAAQDVEGIQVQAPSKSESPDEWADFKAKLNQRQQKMKERREQQDEMKEKRREIKEDFQQAFTSFKKRKKDALEDSPYDSFDEFKEDFARHFYGDPEKGELPRMDIFDIGWDALVGKKEQAADTEPENTDLYKKGFNAAIEQMKSGGADGLPDLKDAAGTGSNDGGGKSSQSSVPDLLAPSGDDGGMNHDQF